MPLGDSQALDPSAEMRAFFQVVRRSAPAAVVLAIAAGVAVFFASQLLPARFEATAMLNLPPASPRASGIDALTFTAPPADPQVYAVVVDSEDVLSHALRSLGANVVDQAALKEFSERISVSQVRGDESHLIRITVEGQTATGAAEAANAVAAAVVAWDQRRADAFLESSISALEAGLAMRQVADPSEPPPAEMTARLQELRALRGSAVSAVQLVVPARSPLEPAAPRPVLYAAVTFVAVGIGMVAVSLLRSAASGRFRGAFEVAAELGLLFLGQFRNNRAPKARAESIRAAAGYAAAYLLNVRGDPSRGSVIAVTSPVHSEPARDLALGLAVAFADLGKPTLFIDADLRSPMTLHTGREKEPQIATLATALRAQIPFPRPSMLARGATAIHVIPAGKESDDAPVLLASGMDRVMGAAAAKYETVVVNTTPILYAPDALGFVSRCDGVILVLDGDVMTKEDTKEAVALIEHSGARVLGFMYTSRHITPYRRAALRPTSPVNVTATAAPQWDRAPTRERESAV